MQAYAADPDVFIRSMAARGHAGGLASTSTAAAAVLDAVGFDLVFVETVGTGQSEVEVAAAADTTVVLEAPEMGDEVQAIKAGLLEVADIVVVNKADRPGAQRTAAQLQAMLVAAPAAARGESSSADAPGPAPSGPTSCWPRPRPARACRSSWPRSTGAGRRSRRERLAGRLARAEAQVWAILADRLRQQLLEPAGRGQPPDAASDVGDHRLDPFSAADRLTRTARTARHGHPERVGSRTWRSSVSSSPAPD